MSKYKEATDKTTGDYPVVISKMDPLIIRVSPLVLVVGTTSYSAKIKTAIKWKGFFIYSSGLGEPIYQQEFKNSDNLQNTNSENSPLYLAVKEEATKWIDSLEDSFAHTAEKNIVDMLREIKFQNHFDLTGHTANASDYPNLEMCTTTPTYIHKILEQLTELNVKLNNLNAIIFGGTLQEVTVDGTDISVDSIGEVTSEIDSTLKNKSVVVRMESLEKKIENVQKSIGIADDEDKTVQTYLKNIGEYIGIDDEENGFSVRGQLTSLNNNLANGLTELKKSIIGDGLTPEEVAEGKKDCLNDTIDKWYGLLYNVLETVVGRIGAFGTGADSLYGRLNIIDSNGNVPYSDENTLWKKIVSISNAPIISKSEDEYVFNINHLQYLTNIVNEMGNNDDGNLLLNLDGGEHKITVLKGLRDTLERFMYPAYKKENDDWVLDYDNPMAKKLWEAFAGKNQYIKQTWENASTIKEAVGVFGDGMQNNTVCSHLVSFNKILDTNDHSLSKWINHYYNTKCGFGNDTDLLEALKGCMEYGHTGTSYVTSAPSERGFDGVNSNAWGMRMYITQTYDGNGEPY